MKSKIPQVSTDTGYLPAFNSVSTSPTMTCKELKSNSKKVKRLPLKGPNISPTTEGLGGEYGWIARGDREPEEKRVPFTKPTIKQVSFGQFF